MDNAGAVVGLVQPRDRAATAACIPHIWGTHAGLWRFCGLRGGGCFRLGCCGVTGIDANEVVISQGPGDNISGGIASQVFTSIKK